MSGYNRSWFEKFVDNLPETWLFRFIAVYILTPFWSWRTPAKKQPGGPHYAIQSGDNLQHMMNLMMPLKDKSAYGKAKAIAAVARSVDQIYAGLDNVGTIHFARFDIIDGNLCMLSVYDGDFSNYIRDFIVTIGDVFDAIMRIVEGGEDLIPCADNVDAFIEYVHEHDLYPVPDVLTDIMNYYPKNPSGRDDLRSLSRKIILQANVNKNFSIGQGYRGYPGFSAAEVRAKLGVGW